MFLDLCVYIYICVRTNEIRENLDAVSVETNVFMSIHVQLVWYTTEIRELAPITRLERGQDTPPGHDSVSGFCVLS